MSQFDFGTIDPTQTSGTQLAADLTSWRNALESNHLGSVSPTYARAGMQYIRQISQTLWQFVFNDGAVETQLAGYNPQTQKYSFSGTFQMDQNSSIYSAGGIPTFFFASGVALYYTPSNQQVILEQEGQVRFSMGLAGFTFYDRQGRSMINIVDSSQIQPGGNGYPVMQLNQGASPFGQFIWLEGANTSEYGPSILYVQNYTNSLQTWQLGVGNVPQLDRGFALMEDANSTTEGSLRCWWQRSSGNMYITGALFQNYSDERLKTDIVPVSDEEAAAFVRNVGAYRHGWNEDGRKVLGSAAKPGLSLLAGQVKQFLPEGAEDNKMHAGMLDFTPLTLNDRPILAMHQAALQWLSARIDELEKAA